MEKEAGAEGHRRAGGRHARSTRGWRCLRQAMGLLALAASATAAGPSLGEPPRSTMSSLSTVRLPAVVVPAAAAVPASAGSRVVQAVATEPEVLPTPRPIPIEAPDSAAGRRVNKSGRVFSGPRFEGPSVEPPFAEVEPAPNEQQLPINLATALRLSDARPLLVSAAQARIQIAAAEVERAGVLWLPDLNVGTAYINHSGGNQATDGSLVFDDTNFFLTGGSVQLRLATTDAIFDPLAARQGLRARRAGLQAARNEALFETADAYFTVQQARGSYAAMIDAVHKGTELVRRIDALSKGLVPRDEVYRARTLLAELQQAAAVAQQQWRVASARLTRILRLNPLTVVVPLEPDNLRITLIEKDASVDELIPIGLTSRPELAAHQSIVQATLARLRREQMRPLLPSIMITGSNDTPDYRFQGGIFGTGSGTINGWAGRSDVATQFIWELENLGFGNQARIRKRRGDTQLAMVELFVVQDRVAAEVFQAKADVESASVRVVEAERGLKEGLATYAGNLKGLGQTTRFGDILYLVNRPQEVTAALQMLEQSYLNYFRTVADFNRSQFRLFYALGFPARILACQDTPGQPEPVDTSRPAYLPRVSAGRPSNYRR